MSVKRRFPRAPLKIPVKYGIKEPICSGRTQVIGEGGMYIESDKVFYKGTELIILFRPPGLKEEKKVRGKVVWTLVKGIYGKYRGPGMGIQFLDVDDQTREAIKEYVNRKKAVLEKILQLLGMENPPMKEINNLLTQTYIIDYADLNDLKKKVIGELEFFSISPPEKSQ